MSCSGSSTFGTENPAIEERSWRRPASTGGTLKACWERRQCRDHETERQTRRQNKSCGVAQRRGSIRSRPSEQRRQCRNAENDSRIGANSTTRGSRGKGASAGLQWVRSFFDASSAEKPRSSTNSRSCPSAVHERETTRVVGPDL